MIPSSSSAAHAMIDLRDSIGTGEGFILLYKRFESRFQLNFGAGFVKFIEVRLAFGQARDKVGQSQIVQLGITQNPAL